jgi:hypothetical protein
LGNQLAGELVVKIVNEHGKRIAPAGGPR